MNVVLNIEYPLGVELHKEHIKFVMEKLQIEENNIFMSSRYNGSWVWALTDVDSKVYVDSIKSIADYFTDLHNKGFVQYFYIGEITAPIPDK